MFLCYALRFNVCFAFGLMYELWLIDGKKKFEQELERNPHITIANYNVCTEYAYIYMKWHWEHPWMIPLQLLVASVRAATLGLPPQGKTWRIGRFGLNSVGSLKWIERIIRKSTTIIRYISSQVEHVPVSKSGYSGNISRDCSYLNLCQTSTYHTTLSGKFLRISKASWHLDRSFI